MVRTQVYFTMSSTLGIQLHVLALYIGHREVVLKLIKELYKMRVGCPGGMLTTYLHLAPRLKKE